MNNCRKTLKSTQKNAEIASGVVQRSRRRRSQTRQVRLTWRKSASPGLIAFTTLLVISAVALAISMSISLLGVGEAKNSLDFKKGQETLKIAEGCVEEALLRIRNDSIYAGGSLSVGNGTCTISVVSAGDDRTVNVVAQITGAPQYTKRLQVSARRAGNSVNLISWQEIE